MLCYIYCSVMFNFVVSCSVLLHLATPACWISVYYKPVCALQVGSTTSVYQLRLYCLGHSGSLALLLLTIYA